MSSRGIGGWIWSVSFSLWTLSTVYLCDWVNTSWAVCSDQPGVLQWFHLLIWICILFVPIWSQYTVPHSDPSLVSILFEHIILKLMCFLWNSGHFSSHFRTFLVEFCRGRHLRAFFFVNSGLFSSHFRTFIVKFCRDRRLRAFPKILKILASSLFSLPCLTIFLTLFEPNSEWHPCIYILYVLFFCNIRCCRKFSSPCFNGTNTRFCREIHFVVNTHFFGLHWTQILLRYLSQKMTGKASALL